LAKAGQSGIIILKIRTDPLKSPADFKLIEKGMTHLSGIISLEVNYVSATVKVYYNPTALTAKRIREKLHELEKQTPHK
jgi:copper chaperone CopZ